ncbi:hypothetical protein D0869_14641 [Hortaea werneckii]|uniref:TOG domain-containing protein n=1 Tax=Hortaea werneckii TaxID=91943 RepID=A0A3M6W250_HORWE|nr:hypothetical protein KC324_g4021 [Hortaea werneckii]KAI7580791.1 hypothetical protein KC316_g8798 [Hortaea werneckii]RMX72416.1 hypothetical protein D0869_14641 [Hortaea werneckii]
MDAQAASLLSTLKRPAAPSESKLASLNQLKSDIKHHRVPENAQATIFECLRIAITQQSSSTLTLSAYSTLGHLAKRLKIQCPHGSGESIKQLAPRLFPALTERLGDLKEPVRAATCDALGELYQFLGPDVEAIVREDAITGGNARAKEAGMGWVVRMHRNKDMPFKSYTSCIVARLEDADGNVREAAKRSLVDLFADAPDRAKTDLKRQLKAHSVRHSIVTQILSHIGTEVNSTGASRPQTRDRAHTPDVQAQDLGGSTRNPPTMDHVAHFADTLNSEAAKPPPTEEVPMDPIYAHSQRELEEAFREMLPYFEGKETEENWMLRDKSTLKLRRFLKGNAPNDYHMAFMLGVKQLMDGILKVANSLRTTMSTNGSQLVQELARTLGPAFDPHGEIVLQNFIKMSAATKPISASNGRATADAVFQNCSYNTRMMQHLWSAAQDKNAQTRQNVPEWLKTILRRQTAYKSGFESSGGLEMAEKCIKKGLDDPKPAVKEGMRGAFWVFSTGWPQKAGLIMAGLSPQARGALEKDPNNPNAGLHASQPSASVTSTSGAAGGRQGGRSRMAEMIAEQRKAKAAGKLPERPNSAMATLSPAKQKAPSEKVTSSRPHSNLRAETRVASSASTASTNAPSEAEKSSAGPGGKRSALMSGPVRRPRRPEIPRPQTADPYASKRLLRPETPADKDETPRNSPHLKTSTGASGRASGIPTTNSAVRNRAKTSGVASPGASPAGRFGSPRGLVHGHPAPTNKEGSRPGSKAGEDLSMTGGDDFTMVLPGKGGVSTVRGNGPAPGMKRQGSVPADAVVPTSEGDAEEGEDGDGFTMVLPSHIPSQSQHDQQQSRARSPLVYQSPLKAMFDEARDKLSRSASPPASRNGSERNEFGGIEEAIEAAGKGSKPASPVQRRGSPVKATTPQPQEEIQIYEDDPFTAEVEANGEAGAEGRKVLGELQVNENVRAQSPTQSHGSSNSPAGSPRQPSGAAAPGRSPQPTQDRAELLRNRRLLSSGIERIRTKTLDAHGFRRVQDLTRSADDELWEADGKKFDNLMAVLLDYLHTFDSDPKTANQPAHKTSGLRIQALGLLRTLSSPDRKPAGSSKTSSSPTMMASWCPKALLTLYSCRAAGGASNAGGFTTTDLDKTTASLLALPAVQQNPESCVQATVVYLSSSPSSTTTVSTSSALQTLRSLLASSSTSSSSWSPSPSLRVEVTRIAARFLNSPDLEVRKRAVELGSECFGFFPSSSSASAAAVGKVGGEGEVEGRDGEQGTGKVGDGEGEGDQGGVEGEGKEAFWREFRGADEGRLGLLTYYIARRG